MSKEKPARQTGARRPQERPGPPGGKRDQNRRRRVAQLQGAALQLFLERGVDSVTIDEIASGAGTAKGNFYRYFNDKEDLVATLLQPAVEQIRGAFERCEQALSDAHDDASLFAAYQYLALGLIPLTLEHGDVVRLYLQNNRAPSRGARAPIRALADEIRVTAVRLTEFAVEHELLRIRDPRISGLAVVGAVEQLTSSVLEGELDSPPAEIGASLISLVLSGIRR